MLKKKRDRKKERKKKKIERFNRKLNVKIKEHDAYEELYTIKQIYKEEVKGMFVYNNSSKTKKEVDNSSST